MHGQQNIKICINVPHSFSPHDHSAEVIKWLCRWLAYKA